VTERRPDRGGGGNWPAKYSFDAGEERKGRRAGGEENEQVFEVHKSSYRQELTIFATKKGGEYRLG